MDTQHDAIDGIEELSTTLEELGYEIVNHDSFVTVNVQGFPATIHKVGESLEITCKIATLGYVLESKHEEFAMACLDLNSRILPYAVALLSDVDDDSLSGPEHWPIVLIDSIPLGDLSIDELSKEMDGLCQAILSSKQVLEIGLERGSNGSDAPIM